MYSQFIDTYLDIDSYIDYILLETWGADILLLC